MDNEKNKTRREFLGDVLWTGSVAAMGGLACLGISRESSGASRDTPDLISMTRIDPEMILYREINEPVPTGFAESRSVTVDSSGILYVAGDQAIRVFNSRGRIRETIKLTVSPFCLVPTDDLFYIGTRDRIVITNKKGEVLATWPSLGDNAWITSMILADEHIYIDKLELNLDAIDINNLDKEFTEQIINKLKDSIHYKIIHNKHIPEIVKNSENENIPFKIDMQTIIVENLDDFVEALDKQFDIWEGAEKAKDGKV